MKLNLATADDATVQQSIDAASQIASERGIPREAAVGALAESVSSTGGNVPEAIALTDLAAQVRPDRPGEIGATAGVLGDIKRGINTDDELAALGFLQTVGGQARVSDPSDQYTNIAPAVIGLTSAGFTEKAAGAIFATFTNTSADTTGSSSGTAAISFGNQLNQFFADRGSTLRGDAALEALQANPELAQEFRDSSSFEQKALAASRGLTQQGSDIDQQYEEFLGQYGGEQAYVAIAQRTLNRLSEGPAERNAEIARQMGTTADDLLLDDFGAGTAGAARESLTDVLQGAGMGANAAIVSDLVFEAGGGLQGGDAALLKARNMIEKRRNALLFEGEVRSFAPTNATQTSQAQAYSYYDTVTPDEQRMADRLGILIEKLESLSANPGGGVNINGAIIINGGDETTASLEASGVGFE